MSAFNADATDERQLLVAFGAVVGLAEHLTIEDVGGTAFGPSGDMVGIHFDEFPDAGAVIVFTEGAEGAVGDAGGLRFGGLLGIFSFLDRIFEIADLQ